MSQGRNKILIHWVPPTGNGWEPIRHLVHLTQQLLSAEIEEIGNGKLQLMRRFHRMLVQPPRAGNDIIIHFACHPGQIAKYVCSPLFERPAARRILWIVDSFWTNRIPKRLLTAYDLVVFMQSYEQACYDRLSGGRSLYIGWGSDVLDLGSGSDKRTIDVLRIGRQPAEWDDDGRSAGVAEEFGLAFQGRPPMNISYSELMACYARSRYVVAFSNLVAPAPYTHPTKAYFTGRWTDAIASGAVVAGISPRQDTGISERLWNGSLLEFDGVDLRSNMAVLQLAVERWKPAIARRNHLNALMKLDWRWRIKRLADSLDLNCPKLEEDLERLRVKARNAGWVHGGTL